MDNQEVKAQIPREKAEHIVSKIISIASIVFFALSFVLVWGTIVTKVQGDTRTNIGIGYLFGSGWKDLPENTKTSYVIQNLAGIVGLVLCIVVTLAVGIPGLIGSIKNVKSGEPYNGKLAKKAVGIAAAQIAYIVLVKSFFFTTGNYGDSTLGWAASAMIAVDSLYLEAVAGYYCFRAFHKDAILPFVVRIISAVSAFVVVGIIISLSGIVFTIDGVGGFSAYMCAFLNADLHAINSNAKTNSLTWGLAIIAVIVALMIFVGITIKKITKSIVGEKEVDHFLPISIVVTILSFVALILSAILGSADYFKNATVAIGDAPIGALSCAILFLGCNIAIIVLNKKIAAKPAVAEEAPKAEEPAAAEAPKAEEEKPAEEPKAEEPKAE